MRFGPDLVTRLGYSPPFGARRTSGPFPAPLISMTKRSSLPNERRRHQLYEEAKRVLSVESADELMSYLPPVGWADVATKADLSMIRSEMDALRADMRGEMAKGYASLQRWTITTLIAMTSLFVVAVFAAVKFGQ